MVPWEGTSKREWRMEMRVSARALKPLVVLVVAAASFGCIAPATYAEDMSVAVTSESGNHVVVDVDLNGGAPNGGSDGKDVEKDGQGNSASTAKTDDTMERFYELMAANDIILKSLFFFYFLPTLFSSAIILISYVFMEWLHERQRL